MKTIENQFKQLRLLGMYVSWNALRETRQHHELSLSEGLELLLHAEQEDRNNRRFETHFTSSFLRFSGATVIFIAFCSNEYNNYLFNLFIFML